MNRRKFLRQGAITGAAVGAAGFVGCHSAIDKTAGHTSGEATRADNFELNETTVASLQQKMASGSLTAKDITQRYLDRIRAIDKSGPSLNAVIEINPDAIGIAAALDEERKAGKVRGPLHGIPVLIKDNIDTADKMMTTAGSLALSGHIAAKDAFIVKKLRDAGAVLLGKTNLSEWANFRSSRSSSGWSSRGGQTKNPCVLDRNPCGSSSGSGAAVAANLCAVAVGTETDGSIIAPSSFNGVVGVKPTVGLLSRTGIIPISSTQDTAGPMTRTVADAAVLLAAMSGADDNDAVTLTRKDRQAPDYSSSLQGEAGLKGKRLGVEKSFLEGNPSVVALYRQAIELLKAKGAEIVEVELVKPCGKLADAEYTVLQFEFKDGLNKYLAGAAANVNTLSEVIAFNKANEAKAMPFFKQEILESCDAKAGLDDREYKAALEKTLGSRKIIDDMLREHRLDCFVSTSIGPANCTDLVNGDYGTGFYFCPPAAMAGYPHITVPMGLINELPVGLSFVAGAYEEAKLFTVAHAYEQASNKRSPPKFLPTMPV